MSSEEKLKKLVSQRGIIKAQLTRFRNDLNSRQDMQNQTTDHLEVRLNQAEKLDEKFSDIQSQIEELDSSEDQKTERTSFENSYIDTIALARQVLRQLIQVSPQHEANNSNSSTNIQTNAVSQSSNLQSATQFRLPTISLPEYSSGYENWLEFSALFKSIIHTNVNIPTIQKFYYLKSSLKDEAAQIISSLEITPENYEAAWKLLTDRYENQRLIVNKHVNALFDIPNIQRESHTSIREIIDNVSKHLKALKALEQPTDHWDTLIIHLVFSKLDYNTKKEWESSIKDNKTPTLEQFITFLKSRAQILENIQSATNTNTPKQPFVKTSMHKPVNHVKAHVSIDNMKCIICTKPHAIFKCTNFLKLSVSERVNELRKSKACFNCLKVGHQLNECQASHCRVCGRKHNTLIHRDEVTNQTATQVASPQDNNTTLVPSTTTAYSTSGANNTQILLATVIVNIIDSNGSMHSCRALLDSGSQSNFITQELCQRLRIQCSKINMPVIGINQIKTNILSKTEVTIKSRVTSYKESISCLVLASITGMLPDSYVPKSTITIPNNIILANPEFNIPNKIDLLLGAGMFWNVLCTGQIRVSKNQPILQETQLGWVISGQTTRITQLNQQSYVSCHLSLEKQLENFWRIEDFSKKEAFTTEEMKCEQHFKDTIKHDETGRFIATLPVRDNVKGLGESRNEAIQRLQSMEKKFVRNPNLKQQYHKFMNEYEHMGHMVKVTDKQTEGIQYFLPHHAVIKNSSDTTKLRVVFDGSCKSSSGISLNDTMMVGPVIQEPLFSIMARFRIHQYVATGDIAKMYRQILIQEDQRNLQQIIWRTDPSEEFQIYQLATVIYGTSCAPYLAVRCLIEAANENRHQFPLASKIIKRDFYVDDLITGSNSQEELQNVITEISNILQSRGFELRQWASNEPNILKKLSQSNKLTTPEVYLSEKEEQKTLGLLWNVSQDEFQFKIHINNMPKKVTKRHLLSTIAQVFDPLGLIGPTTIKAKSILQLSWQLRLEWDEHFLII